MGGDENETQLRGNWSVERRGIFEKQDNGNEVDGLRLENEFIGKVVTQKHRK
jgi:hypothetical protein